MAIKHSTPPRLLHAPSDAVKDLLRQGRRRQAMKLYREQGARGWDFSYLAAADQLARQRHIPIEQALTEMLTPGQESETPREYRLTAPRLFVLTAVAALFGDLFLALSFYQQPDTAVMIDVVSVGVTLLVGVNVVLYLMGAWLAHRQHVGGALIAVVVACIVTLVFAVAAVFAPGWSTEYPPPGWVTAGEAFATMAKLTYAVTIVLSAWGMYVSLVARRYPS